MKKVQFLGILWILTVGLPHGFRGQEKGNTDRGNTNPGDTASGLEVTQSSHPPRPTAAGPGPLTPMPPPEIQVSCSMRYKCEERFGLPLNYHDKNCYCDALCETYGDCCRDYVRPSGIRGRPTKLARNSFTCQRVEEIDRNVEIYVVDSCPRDFTDTDIRGKCEGAISTGDNEDDDAFQRIPVVSKDSKVLYKNFYCAQCGGDLNVSFWRVLLNCEHIPEPLSNISSEAVLEGAVRFARENRQFCGTLFAAPSNDLKARTCKSNIGRCDRSYTERKMAKKCRSHTSYVYVGLEVFKNKFCAQCNYVNESYLSCEDTRTPRIVFDGAPLITAPFSILLDFNTGAGSISEHRMKVNGQIEVAEVVSALTEPPCPDNQVYDHFRRQCRMLVCTGTHHLVGADCVPINPTESELPTTESPDSELKNPGDPAGVDSANPLQPDFEWPNNPNDNRDLDAIDLEYTDHYEYGNPYPHSNGHDPNLDPEGVIPHDPSDPYHDLNSQSNQQLNCPPFMKLNDSEFWLYDNHSVFVYALNQMFHADEVQYDGRFAYVCAPPYRERGAGGGHLVNNHSTAAVNATVIMFTFTYLQSFISFVGLLVSMMALLIMIVMYSAYKQLRTVAGLSAMSLAFALLVAQGLFLFGMQRTDRHIVCLSLGALMHYFFLVAFFWLNAMSFDIYRTFSSSNSEEGGGCRFACYFFYAWLTPACIVGVSLSLDFFQFAADIYQPHYAEHICWIVRRYALLFMFALPIAILLAVNIIIYIISLLKSITANKEKGRGRLLLYIQLSFVMGLTWIFAFIATLTEMWAFWYVFIAFNSFQGIFICFAFVCNKKVFRIIKSKGKVQQQQQQQNHQQLYHQRKDVRFSNGHHRTFSSARHTFLTDGEARIIAQETSI